MAENRVDRRHRKRFPVKFGVNTVEMGGFIDDLNHHGLFIGCSFAVRPGLTIRVEIDHPRGLIALLGEVKWTKKMPPNVLHKLKAGMGVRISSFLAGEAIYRALCNELIEQRGGKG